MEVDAAAHGEEASADGAAADAMVVAVLGDNSREVVAAVHRSVGSCESGEQVVVHKRRREVCLEEHLQEQLTLG